MTCDQIIELVQQSLDGTESARLSSGVEDHLRMCRHCDNQTQSLRRIHGALRNLESPSPESLPAGFHERLLSRLANEPVHRVVEAPPSHRQARPASRPIGRRQAMIAAAALAAALVLLILARPQFPVVTPRSVTHAVPAPQLTPAPDVVIAPTPDVLETIQDAEIYTRLAILELPAMVPTPHRVYTSVGAEVSDLTLGFVEATDSLTSLFTPQSPAVRRQ